MHPSAPVRQNRKVPHPLRSDAHGLPSPTMILSTLQTRPAPPQPAFISREVNKARRFYLELNRNPRRLLCVAFGGWEQCAPHYQIKRDGFPYYLVEYVVGGEGQAMLNGHRHMLKRGSIFTYGPNCSHRLSSDPTKCLAKYFVGISGSRALALLKAHGLAPGTCRIAADPDEVQTAFEQLIVEGSRGTSDTAQLVALQMQVLLLKMNIKLEPLKPPPHQAFQTFKRCRTFLDEHFLEVATAEEAAEACHLDPAYASRLFARFGYGSFYDYLVRRKMTWAADRLADGHLIVREVADRLGMNAFHFSRVFKRVHGIPPSSFLQRMENCAGKA